MNKMKVGTDIINIKTFEKVAKAHNQRFLKKVFNSEELKNEQIDHLAGVFSAKEALIKTTLIGVGGWKDVSIIYEKSGRPKVKFIKSKLETKVKEVDVSISHNGDYAIAFAIVVFKSKSN